ncbi:MAG: glycoside hydrolase family 16 protein [Aquaticitalea sp.]
MKNLNKIISLIALVIFFASCQEDDSNVGPIVAPTNLSVSAEIVGQDADNPYGDGSGVVNFSATADNAITFRFVAPGNQQIAPSGNASIPFTAANSGVYTYHVTVVAFGTGGISTSTSIQVEVFVDYVAPPELIETLVGDGDRKWRIKSEAPGHFGLGPVGGNIPVEWYGAGPGEKAGVGMYDDRYVFESDGTFTHITNNTNDDPTNDPSGTVFGRNTLINELNGSGSGNPEGDDITNYPYNDYSETWNISAPSNVETLTLSGIGFIGYYTGGSHQYRIFDRSVPNELILATVDGNGDFTWWFTITSEEPGAGGFTSIYNTILWEDNFDTDGAPDPTNWTFDLGTGDNGWGNGELQTYTDNAENVIVEGGFLKITAKANGNGYTSSRLKSENLREFTYGRVEVRAKLPEATGTWPAIWMLGADYETNTWPACGEIDIMEQTGQDKNTTLGTLHYPGVSPGAGNGNSIANPTSTTEFHNYTVEWTPDVIKILVDDTVFHSFANTASTPFNSDFFVILNVAMGGSLGGTVDPAFTESSMEIDYVKVFE